MAVVTDILQTVLEIKGASAFIADMGLAAGALQGVAAGAVSAAEGVAVLEAEILGMSAGALAAAAAVAALTAAVVLSLKQFAEDEQVWIKLARAMHNAGTEIPFAEVQAYAQARQSATGIDDEATAALIAQLIQLRFNTRQWQELVPAIQEAEAAGLGSAKGIAAAINRYLATGRAAGLAALGIDVNKVAKEKDKVGEIVREMLAHAKGSIEDAHLSLTGSFIDLAEQFKNLLSAIGDALAPVLIPILQFFTAVIKQQIATLDYYMAKAGIKRQSNIDAERIAKSAVQGGFGARDSDNLEKVAKNTQQTFEAIARQSFGGPGTAVRAALNLRSIRAAIRTGAG